MYGTAGAGTRVWADADGRAQGRYFNSTLTSAFQSIRALADGRVCGYEAFARSYSESDQGLCVWKLLDHAANDDESVELDRLCRMLHSINFFRQPEAADADLYLSVHARLLAAVDGNHGTAFRRVLGVLELPQARLGAQCRPGIIRAVRAPNRQSEPHEMTIAPYSAFCVLVVPGLHGSGPEHWQTRWQRLHPEFERVQQAYWDVPELAVWSARLGRALQQSARPTLIVAHSFGCLATVHCAHAGLPNVAGALLVAPADPFKFDVAHMLADVRLPYPSLLVGSANDPWMEGRRASQWAARWGSAFVNLGALGHINAESGLGDWPAGLSLLRELAATASAFIAPAQGRPALREQDAR